MPPDRATGIEIAQVPEGWRIFPQLTVLENLHVGAFLRRDREGVNRDMEMVFRHFPPFSSSRGKAKAECRNTERRRAADADY